MFRWEPVPHGNGWESTLSDEQKEFWGRFLVEVTQQLVYHIVFEFKAIRQTKLRKKFEDRFRYDPMDFFYWRQFYRHCEHWYKFLDSIPSLDATSNVVKIQWSGSPRRISCATKLVTCGTGAFEGRSEKSIARYCNSLLFEACQLVTKGNVIDVNRKDKCGNIALHLIAALPGDSSSLIEHLLHVGADPLVVNNVELSAVHIIAGRIKNHYGSWSWGRESTVERVESSSWKCDDRATSLRVLLPRFLAMNFAENGNTPIHECVLSIQTIRIIDDHAGLIQERSKVEEEIKIVSQLLESSDDASLLTQNVFGLVPLHFAFSSRIFEFLLSMGANCRQTSRMGETPFLFILKYFVGLAIVHAHSEQAYETQEIRKLLNKDIRHYSIMLVKKSPIRNATFVLRQLTKLAKIPAVKSTIWDADDSEITPLFLLLMFARVACYRPNPERSKSGRTYSVRRRGWDEVWKQLEDLNEFENALVECVRVVVEAAGSKKFLAKGFLHILLDLGASADGIKIISRMTSVVKSCLVVLIQHGADVNEQDKSLRTALHLICQHYHKCPYMYQECAKLLAECGAYIDVEDKWGRSVKELIKRNVQLQSAIVSKIRTTRIVHSSSRRHSSTVEQLTKNGRGVTVVGKCRFMNTNPIGRGAFSHIYAAIKDESENKESGTILCREVALKRLEKARIDPRDMEREVKTLLAISPKCENIVDYYDTTEDKNFSYIILELMEGDLRELVADKEMTKIISEPTMARQAVLDIVKGLAYLHEYDFLHRDLKPGNILYKVDPRLCLKIADFGLAKDISGLTSMTTTGGGGSTPAGTRCWMAPELVRQNFKSSKHTKESDVFALGLVLHYLLTFGKHPFDPSTRMQLPEYLIEGNIVSTRPSLDLSLSDEANNFIGVIIAKEPTRRPSPSHLQEHPFLWSDKKKIEFLKAVGDQREAIFPVKHPNSRQQLCLDATKLQSQFISEGWNTRVPDLYSRISTSWPQKKYRTNQVIDLVRFVRNVYTHKEEQPEDIKRQINDNLLLKKFPTLVLEVYIVLNNEGFLDDPERTNIQDALRFE